MSKRVIESPLVEAAVRRALEIDFYKEPFLVPPVMLDSLMVLDPCPPRDIRARRKTRRIVQRRRTRFDRRTKLSRGPQNRGDTLDHQRRARNRMKKAELRATIAFIDEMLDGRTIVATRRNRLVGC